MVVSFLEYKTYDANIQGRTTVNINLKAVSRLLKSRIQVVKLGYRCKLLNPEKANVTGSISTIVCRKETQVSVENVTTVLAETLPV